MSLSVENKVRLMTAVGIKTPAELEAKLSLIANYEESGYADEIFGQIEALLDELKPILYDTLILEGGSDGTNINEGRTRDLIIRDLNTLLNSVPISSTFGFTQLIPT